MSEPLTPETLRRWASPEVDYDEELAGVLERHADAWEADRKRLEAMEREAILFQDELVEAINDPRHFKGERNGLRMAGALFRKFPTLAAAQREKGKEDE